jgi:hypothetical protein
MPGPIAGTRRWDRRAIDAALDRLSNLDLKLEVGDRRERADRAFDEWLENAG